LISIRRRASRPSSERRRAPDFTSKITFLTNSLQEELMIWQHPERLTGTDSAATRIVNRGAEKRAEAYGSGVHRNI
jgi:glutathione S-transferase